MSAVWARQGKRRWHAVGSRRPMDSDGMDSRRTLCGITLLGSCSVVTADWYAGKETSVELKDVCLVCLGVAHPDHEETIGNENHEQ